MPSIQATTNTRVDWEASPRDYHLIKHGISSSSMVNTQEGRGALKIEMSNTDSANQTLSLLPTFEVLVPHYSNYGTENKTVTSAIVFCGNTQMPYV
jgi:hypothetical protein